MWKQFLCGLSVAGLLLAADPKDKLTIYDFNLPDIGGKMTALMQFKGKVLLVVNVASNSSYTPQYAALQSLYDKYKAAGLVVLGFPSNDFGNQEPDSESKIKAFCESTYHITFPLFSKVDVRGDDETPVFHFLTKEANPDIKADVHWNFTKFLIDRKGQLTARFEPNVEPDDPDVLVALEGALSGKDVPTTRQTPPSPPPGGDEERRTRAGI